MSHIARDEKCSITAAATQDTTILTVRKKGRPSSSSPLSSPPPSSSKPITRQKTAVCDKTKCFFCQPLQVGDPEPKEKQKEKLYNCRTTIK